MKNVIVTGANGFIGSWLCKELSDNSINVTAVVRNEKSNVSQIKNLQNVSIVYCELKDIKKLPNKIENKNYDTFFHLAWEGAGGKERSDYGLQLKNIKYSCDCVEAAKAIGCNKILASGTISEKIADDILNIDSKAENIIYGISKSTAHKMLDILCENLKMNFVWMRFSNVYGPQSINGNIVGYTIAEFIKGNTPVFSKAEQPYDLLYIEDLVRAIYLIGKTENKRKCYYIGSGNSQQLKDYLKQIRDIYGKGREIRLGERPEDGLLYYKEWFCTNDLVKDVDFKPSYSFEEGIRKTIEWMEENIDNVI